MNFVWEMIGAMFELDKFKCGKKVGLERAQELIEKELRKYAN